MIYAFSRRGLDYGAKIQKNYELTKYKGKKLRFFGKTRFAGAP